MPVLQMSTVNSSKVCDQFMQLKCIPHGYKHVACEHITRTTSAHELALAGGASVH